MDENERNPINVNVLFTDILTLLLNLDNGVNLSICKNIVSCVMHNLTPEDFSEEVKLHFYGTAYGGDLKVDYPKEYDKLCKLFGCLAL
jgi:hypothetical protein